MDASNLLKPMLARGELRCIGATTLAEYKQFIEKDKALERRCVLRRVCILWMCGRVRPILHAPWLFVDAAAMR